MFPEHTKKIFYLFPLYDLSMRIWLYFLFVTVNVEDCFCSNVYTIMQSSWHCEAFFTHIPIWKIKVIRMPCFLSSFLCIKIFFFVAILNPWMCFWWMDFLSHQCHQWSGSDEWENKLIRFMARFATMNLDAVFLGDEVEFYRFLMHKISQNLSFLL